jgi:hypothetical protein
MAAFLLTGAAALSACSGGADNLQPGPNIPGETPSPTTLKQAAFVFDVNTATKEVKISAPAVKLDGKVGSLGSAANLNVGTTGSTKPSFSVLAGDAVQLATSNYVASGVGTGGAPAGKVLVKFDVSIFNRLTGAQLQTPTFPTPPTGLSGIILFPFSTNVTTTSGGTSTGGDGTTIIVDLPNTGQVQPSTDWDGDGSSAFNGSPFSFFNDTQCSGTVGSGTTSDGSTPSDCYRYEVFPSPLGPAATSPSRTVGFVIDPTVSNFRARIILAADVANSGPPVTTTINGVVSSPQRGLLGGVTVTSSVDGNTTTAAGTGAYSINATGTGQRTISLSNLPSGCTAPASQTVTVGATPPAGGYTANFTVTCSAAVGTVTGTITRTGTGTQSFAGIIVTATPAASGTTASTQSLAAGATGFSVANVQVGVGTGAGNGQVTLSNLPSGCSSSPASLSYSGLTSGGSQGAGAFTINCVAPPAQYQYFAVWGTPSGSSVTLTLRVDPSTGPNPIPLTTEAPNVAAFQTNTLTLTGPAAGRLTLQSCASPSTGGFTVNATNTATGAIIATKTGAGATTLIDVAVCTYSIAAGAAGTATTVTSFASPGLVGSAAGNQLNGFFPGTPYAALDALNRNEGTITLP